MCSVWITAQQQKRKAVLIRGVGSEASPRYCAEGENSSKVSGLCCRL